MDTRRLYSFVKIVDAGSITRAADILHIAQPALSQQISTLETQFKQQLLIRSKRGVAPTEAGRALYRHAQLILRQVELAQAAVDVSGRAPAGRRLGGPGPVQHGRGARAAAARSVRERYPDILLHINENFGGVISEAIMTGRMDMAFIYEAGPLPGVQFEPMRTEDLFLIAAPGRTTGRCGGATSPSRSWPTWGCCCPAASTPSARSWTPRSSTPRSKPRVIGEIESVLTLVSAVGADLGATVLPWSAARAILDVRNLVVRRIVDPAIPVKLSLCTSDHQPLSEPAHAVHDLFHELIADFGET